MTKSLEVLIGRVTDRLDTASQALKELGAVTAGTLIVFADSPEDFAKQFRASVDEVKSRQAKLEAFLERVGANGLAHSPVIYSWAVELIDELKESEE